MRDDTLYDKVTLPLTDTAPKAGETPFFLAILLLIFFPPAAWYIMWKEEGFDHWLGYLIGFYGVLAIAVSFITKQMLHPQIVDFYARNNLQEPSISPLSYLSFYYIIGVIEIIFSVILYFIHDIHKKLPKNWLIAGVTGLAISSIIPFTFIYLTYTAFNNLLEQTKPANRQPLIHSLTPTLTPMVSTQENSSTQFVEKAKEELATKLQIDPSTISEVSVVKKMWSDGSLGCPKSGMMYAQALVNGYQILLEVNNKQYDFHAANTVETVFLCE